MRKRETHHRKQHVLSEELLGIELIIISKVSWEEKTGDNSSRYRMIQTEYVTANLCPHTPVYCTLSAAPLNEISAKLYLLWSPLLPSNYQYWHVNSTR